MRLLHGFMIKKKLTASVFFLLLLIRDERPASGRPGKRASSARDLSGLAPQRHAPQTRPHSQKHPGLRQKPHQHQAGQEGLH